MLKKFLEEVADRDYVMNFHYNPNLHEFYICVTKAGDIFKSTSTTLPAKHLSDDQKIVDEIKRLIAQLEESNDG